jgi:predicted RNA methylase
MQTTGLKRDTIDKYYTKSSVAKQCCDIFKQYVKINPEIDVIIEPSAGNGSFIPFLSPLCDTFLFFDIEPESPLIVKQDYLLINPISLVNRDTLTKHHAIGNPPFGRQSSSAIKFIKKSAEFCNTISFILPNSFKKESMQKHFPEYFHLIFQCDLEKNSFIIGDRPKDVPCVFQIWEKKSFKRQLPSKLVPAIFDFVKKDENPDISFRRVGVNAGKIEIENLIEKSKESHYFIKFHNFINKVIIIEKMKKIQYETNNTVGPKSISKQELIHAINQIL